jgi:membrane protease YdiL (CAAX protease family)
LAERFELVRWRRVVAFYGLTLSLTAAGTLAWTLSGGTLSGTAGTLVLNLCMLAPGLVAWALQRSDSSEPVGIALAVQRPRVRWLLVAWLLAAGLMLLALVVGVLLPGASFSTDMGGLARIGMSSDEVSSMRSRLPTSSTGAVAAALLQGLLLGPTVLLVGALGEELGWRGLLHRELAPLGWWPRSVVTGLLWGAWHFPFVFQGYAYPRHPVLGSLLLLILTQLLAPIYAWLRERSESIFVPAVFHGTCGGTSMVAIAFVSGGDELLSGFTGVAGLVAAAMGCAVALASYGISRRTAHAGA